MVKFSFLALHILFGVAGTFLAAIALHFRLLNDGKKVNQFAFYEFLSSMLALVTAGVYYIIFYQPDKAIIINGKFPLAHELFMEVKEHVFIMFFLLSLYLQFRFWFTETEKDISFIKESKTVLILIIFLGVFMSVMGILVNIGFRVNQ